MSLQTLSRIILLPVVGTILHGSAALLYAQVQSPPSEPAKAQGASVPRAKIYEDDEIKLTIPADWRIVPQNELNAAAGVALGNSVRGTKGTLLLEKDRYTLAIAYHTGQASGIEGGRFIEIFNIPWPNVDDQWNCSGYFGGYAQPASRVLIFYNRTVDSSDAKVRENCGIRRDLGHWIEKDGVRSFEGERRWFGGFFTTERGYFFDSNGEGCGEKAYTLTFQADTPDQLPDVDDPRMKKMTQEAIDIVDSIGYKRCSPASAE
jgi:hypothetical protein